MMSAPGIGSPWLGILGIGEDGVEGLSARARQWLSQAETVYGGARHLALAAPLAGTRGIAWERPLTASLPGLLARRGERVAVLASGDPFAYGIGPMLAGHVPHGEWFCIPVPSCLSLARAVLGWAEAETDTVSLCGRPLSLLRPSLQPGARLLILSADGSTPGMAAREMARLGFGGSMVWVMEALGGPAQRIRKTTAEQLDFSDIGPLNLLAAEVTARDDARIIPLTPGLTDDWLDHDGQITKKDIRAVTLSALAPRRGECLWDIGCGSGSIAIEWLLRHPSMRAIGIEAEPARAGRARENARQCGVSHLRVIDGRAPEALAGLPVPDAVFIGGGYSRAVLEQCQAALRPGGRLAVNAVTLETEALLAAAFQAHGGDMMRLAVSRIGAVGRLHAFRPAITVTQWVWRKAAHG